jgi:hypothetical protein
MSPRREKDRFFRLQLKIRSQNDILPRLLLGFVPYPTLEEKHAL